MINDSLFFDSFLGVYLLIFFSLDILLLLLMLLLLYLLFNNNSFLLGLHLLFDFFFIILFFTPSFKILLTYVLCFLIVLWLLVFIVLNTFLFFNQFLFFDNIKDESFIIWFSTIFLFWFNDLFTFSLINNIGDLLVILFLLFLTEIFDFNECSFELFLLIVFFKSSGILCSLLL